MCLAEIQAFVQAQNIIPPLFATTQPPQMSTKMVQLSPKAVWNTSAFMASHLKEKNGHSSRKGMEILRCIWFVESSGISTSSKKQSGSRRKDWIFQLFSSKPNWWLAHWQTKKTCHGVAFCFNPQIFRMYKSYKYFRMFQTDWPQMWGWRSTKTRRPWRSITSHGEHSARPVRIIGTAKPKLWLLASWWITCEISHCGWWKSMNIFRIIKSPWWSISMIQNDSNHPWLKKTTPGIHQGIFT